MSEQQPTILKWESLKPYVTVVVLQCIHEDRDAAFVQLEELLSRQARRSSRRAVEIVAMASSSDAAAGVAERFGLDRLGGFVRRSLQPPSWAIADSGFLDVVHDLTIALRRGDLVAVRAEGDVEGRLQRWLDGDRRPYRRVHPAVLENALLPGEAKSLWLRGTHRRSTLRPDVKTVGGNRVQETLSPWEDSSFAMGSAKAVLPDDPSRTVLRGTIGVTSRRSSVWFKALDDFPTFVTAVLELLAVIDEEIAKGTTEPRTLTLLARQVTDLSAVHDAYDIAILDPEHLGGLVSDDVYEAADVLEDAVLLIHGGPTANFQLEVGLNGSVGGKLAGTVRQENGKCKLTIGLDPTSEPTDPETVQLVAKALRPELVSVYYKSGHAYVDNQVWTTRISRDRFPNWDFRDFVGYRLTQEKPATKVPQEIHDQTGVGGKTLFDWVVERFKDGWLTCDDGAGELADFVHISPSRVLTLIHVKGAENDSDRRQVSAAAYEVVAGQAVKNLIFIADLKLLRACLEDPVVPKPATWTNGVRVSDRAEFLDAFDKRGADDLKRVVIVQPHVSEATYGRLRVDPLPFPPSDDMMRLFRLEAILTSARTSAVSISADLSVISSKT